MNGIGFFIKSAIDEWFDQEECIFRNVVFPKKNHDLIIYRDPTDKNETYIYPIKIKVLDVDNKGITFQQYDYIAKEYKEQTRINIGEPYITKGEFTFVTNRERETIKIYLHDIEYLFTNDQYEDLETYTKLIEKCPELLPRILKEGNTILLYHIYNQGLFGIEKDEERATSYLVGERDYDRFFEWRNNPENKSLIDSLNKKYGGKEGFIFDPDVGSRKTYLIAKYKYDHNDFSALPYYISLMTNLFGYKREYESLPITLFLGTYEMSKLVIENNLYTEYTKDEIIYEHCVYASKVTMIDIYGAYLIMKESFEKNGKYSLLSAIKNDEVPRWYSRNNIFDSPTSVDSEITLLHVTLAKEKGDELATKLLEHYHK